MEWNSLPTRSIAMTSFAPQTNLGNSGTMRGRFERHRVHHYTLLLVITLIWEANQRQEA